MPSNTFFGWRDGAGLVKYNGRLLLFGGWNTALFPITYSCNEVWESLDDGATWIQIANAPWTPRHSFGYGVKGGKIWLWGGDFLSGSYQRDVWTFDDVNGWIQVTADWGNDVGDRVLFGFTIHNNFMYVVGGQNDYSNSPTMFTDTLKSDDGITWQAVGTLPISYFSTGVVVSHNGFMYMYAGGRYRPAGHDHANTNIYKSTNGGATWSLLRALPVTLNGFMYCSGGSMGGSLLFLNGATSGGNQDGLWFTPNEGVNWVAISPAPIASHARAICTDGDNLFIASGNLANDIFTITANTI